MKNAYTLPMQTWPGLEGYAGRLRLPRNNLSVFLYRAGPLAPALSGVEAPVLLLVHGLGDEADTWRHLLPALAEKQHVFALDLPGFGRSDKPDRAYTPRFFCDVILELLDALELPRATLVGHSLGAMLCHAIALEQPQRVERLVLIGGSLVAGRQRPNLATLLFLVPGLGEWLYNRLRKDPQAAYRSLTPYYHALESLPQAERDFLFQRVNQRVWNDEQRRAFFSTLRSVARWLPDQQSHLSARLANLDTPTTVIWGAHDQVNPVENAQALAAAQPGVRLVIVPDAGHNLQQEKPQHILPFLTL